jgi:hypothetical protein
MVKDPGTRYQSAPGQLLDAHYRFMQDLTEASTDLQQRLRTLQLEYQSACLRASQSQQPEDAQAATDAWQQLARPTWTDTDLQERAREAYRNYLVAVGGMLSAGDIDAVDPATLCAISQSLATVSAYAAQVATPTPTPAAAEATGATGTDAA